MIGRDDIRKKVKATITSTGFENVRSFGLIRDSDSDPNGAIQSLSDALGEVWQNTPSAGSLAMTSAMKQDVAGGKYEGKQFRLGMMLLPGEGKAGELEDLVLQALEGVPILDCVSNYLACLGGLKISPKKQAKSKVQVYLAAGDKPNISLGVAAERKAIPLDSPVFDSLRNFLVAMAADF